MLWSSLSTVSQTYPVGQPLLSFSSRLPSPSNRNEVYKRRQEDTQTHGHSVPNADAGDRSSGEGFLGAHASPEPGCLQGQEQAHTSNQGGTSHRLGGAAILSRHCCRTQDGDCKAWDWGWDFISHFSPAAPQETGPRA